MLMSEIHISNTGPSRVRPSGLTVRREAVGNIVLLITKNHNKKNDPANVLTENLPEETGQVV